MTSKNNKKGAIIQIALILVAIAITGLFFYGIQDLQKQKREGNQTIGSFGDFLKDVFKRTEVKEQTEDAKKTIGCLAKINECKLHDITCIPTYNDGKITFTVVNSIQKINYDLNKVQISIQAGDCTGNLSGAEKLPGSGSGRIANYTIACEFQKCLQGNISFTAYTKEQIRFDDKGGFSVKN